MSLFDYFTIKGSPLVPSRYHDIILQTKDLGRGMEDYELRPDNRIWRLAKKYEWISDSKKTLGGYAKVVDQKWLIKSDVDGFVEVHGTLGQEWVSLLLEVQEGIVVNCKETL